MKEKLIPIREFFGRTVCAIALGAVFALAGISKLFAPATVATVIESQLKIPPPLNDLAAAITIGIELLLGISLILGIQRRLASLLSLTILVIFTAVAVMAISTGSKSDCGCFPGIAEQSMGWGTVARNIVLMLIALIVFLSHRQRNAVMSST